MSIVVGRLATREGRAALRRAAQEARTRRLPLIVLDTARHQPAADSQEVQLLEQLLTEVGEQLDEHGLRHEVRTLTDGVDAAENLITAAEQESAELIVIGLRRRTPVGKLILGSHAQRILLDASCPVLAVKAEATG